MRVLGLCIRWCWLTWMALHRTDPADRAKIIASMAPILAPPSRRSPPQNPRHESLDDTADPAVGPDPASAQQSTTSTGVRHPNGSPGNNRLPQHRR